MSSTPLPPEPTVLEERRTTPAKAPPASGKCHVLTLSVLSLFLIGFSVWLIFAWSRYAERYAQATEGWHVGGIRMVELTLVKEDIHNLACASDQVRNGLHCRYRGDRREFGPTSPDDPRVLQPYNTIKNELLFGAGLWSSPALKQGLPPNRFTVVCNFHVVGVMKSISARWSPSGNFGPVTQSVTAGTLTDCVIPQ